jgi:serine protease AprX
MSISLALPYRIRWGLTAAASTAMLALLVVLATLSATASKSAAASNAATSGIASAPLVRLADKHPGRPVEAIVQFDNGVNSPNAHRLVRANGGRVTGELPIINGLVARISAGHANGLAHVKGVRVVSLNAAVKKTSLVSGIDTSQIQTSYPDSVRAPKGWSSATGTGVGVAVVDTGIAGTIPDFRASQSNSASRVVATVATNPYATTDNDSYGHGTHVAGIIAGNSNNRPSGDPLKGDYVGVAPDANLVSIKVADEQGNATLLDVLYGLQFAVDNKDAYNIRVVNLSLESTQAQSYKTDPLDAAAEAAWFNGIVVVAAAGNRGTAADAVNYAPGNDPYVISVGGVDDQGTKNTIDDTIASWSSTGTTQDGFAKPDVLAPGAHIVSNLAPNSAFASMCPACVVDGQYIRAGGTSMAAPMVSGAIADLLQARPNLTPDQVKAAVLANGRKVLASSLDEVSVSGLVFGDVPASNPNAGLTPNTLIDTKTGNIDYSRSSWSRSSWSRSSWSRSSWSRSSWSCACSKSSTGSIDPTRSSWSRSSWSTSWTK